jgi:tetratricopeptide (TPR) repeat protein
MSRPDPGTLGWDFTLRWDFVTDPPIRLLSELEAARRHLWRGRPREAERAARRLLRHVADRVPGDDPVAQQPARMAIIGADGSAVRALALHLLDHPEGERAVTESVSRYTELIEAKRELRPPSQADYGMVLVVAGRPLDAVDPLVRAVEAGEDVSVMIVRTAAAALLDGESVSDAVRLLRAVHERYPGNLTLAIDFAAACEGQDDPGTAADAHVAAGALCAEGDRYEAALEHFRRAGEIVPAHPLAALGRCQSLLAVGDVDTALTALDRLLEEQPRLAGTHAVRALALAQLGRTEDAVRAVDEGLARFRDDPWLLDTRVRVLRTAGTPAAALAAVDDALHIDATDRTWRGLRAELLLEQGRDVDEAIQTLRELTATAAGTALPAVRLVHALRRLGRRSEALDVVVRALAEYADDARLVAQEVDLLRETGRSAEAADRARAAIARGVDPAGLLIPLAAALLGLDDAQAAVQAAEQAVTRHPGIALAHRLHGLARQKAEEFQPAVDELTRAIQLGDDDPDTERALVTCLVRLARESSADRTASRRHLERALDLAPHNTPARLMLIDLLRAESDYPAALEHAEQGLAHHRRDADLLARRGLVREALGQADEAEADLFEAVRIDPSLTWVHAELGEFLRTRGRPADALAELTKAMEGQPDNAWILASKGATEYALDLFDEAQDSLTRALAADPSYVWARGVLAVVLADVDDLAGARAEVARVLAEDPTLGWCWALTGWLALFEDDVLESAGSDALDRAAVAFERALQYDQRDVSALTGLGEALTLQGHGDRAEEMFQRAAEGGRTQTPPDANTQANIGWSLLRLTRYEEAVDAFLRALALDANLTAPAFGVALALLCAGRKRVAMEEFHQAVLRTWTIRHVGRRRAAIREFSRDLEAMAATQLRERTEQVDQIRALLTTARLPRSEDGALRSGDLQVSPT